MISATHYPYSDEQCSHLPDIVCAAIRDSNVKFTPLSYVLFYQAAMNGFTCSLSDELMSIDKGKELEHSLNSLYHKYIGKSFINNVALLDDITEKLNEGSNNVAAITQQSSSVLDQQMNRLDADIITSSDLISIAGKLKKEVMTISISQYVFLETLTEAQAHIDELKHKIADLQKLVSVDQLTNLHSRFAYDEFLRKLTTPPKNYQTLSLAIANIDHFKVINENFGYHVGDAVLRYVSQKIKQAVTNEAFVARYSGKSFALIFVDTPPQAVEQHIQRVRNAIIYSKILIRSTKQEIGNLTASFGIVHAFDKDTEDTLQSRAEQAMLLSKQSGRDQITIL